MRIKYFKQLTLAVLLVFALIGCTAMGGGGLSSGGACFGPQQWVDRQGAIQTMENPEESALCKIDPYWTETEIGLFAVNAIALKNKVYKTEDVLKVTTAIREKYYSVPKITVGELAVYAAMQIKQSPELFVVSKTLDRYKGFTDLVLDDFSWYHINKHLMDQDVLAAMYAKPKSD